MMAMKTKIYHKIGEWFRKNPVFSNGLVNGNFVKFNYTDILFITVSSVKNIQKVVTEKGEAFDPRTLEQFANNYNHLVQISKSFVVNVVKLNKRSNWSIVWIGFNKFKVGRKYRKILEQKCESIL